MKNLMKVALLTMCVAGLASAQTQSFVVEDPPVAPQLECTSARFAEEYARMLESQSLMPSSHSPDLRDWESVKRLTKGTKIRVVNGDFKKRKGRFIEASEQQLTFKANGKVVTLDRDNIRMVSLRFGPSTGERILMGLLEGAIIGAFAYAEASLCEKHGCQDDRTGEWYEGSGKAPSARTGYIAAGVGAAGMGILAAYAKPQDVVIYFHQERVAILETPDEFAQAPLEPAGLEGGNIFAPVTHEPEEGSRMAEE